MIRKILIAGAALLAMAVSACTTIPSVPAGPFAVGGNQVTLDRQWSDVTIFSPGGRKSLKQLSIDGPLLDNLYVSNGLAPGAYLLKPAKKETPTPTVRAGMTPTEQVEFVTDNLSVLGYQRIEVASLKPGKTANGQQAIRATITAKTKAGLDISVLAQMLQVKDRLYLVMYVAPTEHYYGASLKNAESVMDSMAPTGS
ncbi:hypothetical protein QO010_004625 [Caulobacter ginsengisoli]|uniref:DUF1795 domain-containing protein n=1 Tax=Caulobacter ginsengisoli TaxID=400775 RepID=A0ABU0J0K8_9CAUL|nr:hypothetical protein [Caulobacter ginsengisoli]MDQ0466829.1 hypothetical protein [Caulobacter ginsengisoli]